MIESHDSKVALAKIVLFGPGGSGKGTTLSHLLGSIPAGLRSELTRIDSHGDTLLTIEIIPSGLSPIAGRSLQIQMVAATGVVENEATYQRLLEDADGIIFTADSRVGSMAENVRLLDILEDTLADLGFGVDELPMVVQMNHRDDRRLYTIEEMNAKLNPLGGAFVETVAATGVGIFVVLKQILDPVVKRVTQVLIQTNNQSVSVPRPSLDDDTVQFGNSESGSEAGEGNEEAASAPKSVFSFPATKRTWDGEGPSPFGQPDTDDENDKGGLWRRLAKPFKK